MSLDRFLNTWIFYVMTIFLMRLVYCENVLSVSLCNWPLLYSYINPIIIILMYAHINPIIIILCPHISTN